MNIIKHKRYVLEFDVWEPLEAKVLKEMDSVVMAIKQSLSHAGNVRIVSEEVTAVVK